MRSDPRFSRRTAKGSALIVILIILSLAAALLVSGLKSNPRIERDKTTADALAKAKDALIGYAATYRDSHPSAGPTYDQVFGYLPCPAVDGNGVAAADCGAPDVTQIGLLPWKTLGLPPLRDSAGECLWYAVSGRLKNNHKTAVLNWDTAGQFIINDAGGAALASGVAAMVFSPRDRVGNQNRTPAGTTECGGNSTVAAYLDGGDPIYAATTVPITGAAVPAAGANTTLTVATIASIANGTNNDQGLRITPTEIFDRVKRRSDFKTDIDTMMADLVACLNNLPPASLPAATGSKGIGSALEAICKPLDGTTKGNVYQNWKDNLLYVNTGGTITVNGGNCKAALIFGGERTTRTVSPFIAQTRATAAEKNDAGMYLEGVNATSFPNGTTYSGIAAYTATSPSADVVACITGAGGGTMVSFSNPTQFSKFQPAGVGVTVNPDTQTAQIVVAGGSGGGCLWYPDAMPLSGKTLRTYYEFKFSYPDPPSGPNLGYGLTLSFVEGDAGKPTTCGTQSTMGVIPASTLPFSLFVETDIYQSGSAYGEPNGTPNHTAIMANGNTAHSATNGNLTTACDGTAAGCNHSLSNQFEESPVPLLHNQRVEIHGGYNGTCTASGGTYSLVKVWVDCSACDNTTSDFAASNPTVTRCISLDSSMNNVYFGFTAGFSSSGGQVQGVTLQKLELRVE